MTIGNHKLYQLFKYTVYGFLALNVYWFFAEEYAAAALQFSGGLALGDIIEAFEMEETPEVLAVQETYTSLARTMLAGTEGLMPDPLEDDHIFRIFSMTKPITAVALMTLFDEGKFELDDPVSAYLPEFKHIEVYSPEGDIPVLEEQVEEMTIRHLLTHTTIYILSASGSFRLHYQKF